METLLGTLSRVASADNDDDVDIETDEAGDMGSEEKGDDGGDLEGTLRSVTRVRNDLSAAGSICIFIFIFASAQGDDDDEDNDWDDAGTAIAAFSVVIIR